MNHTRYEVFADPAFLYGPTAMELFIIGVTGSERALAAPLEFSPVKDYELPPAPTVGPHDGRALLQAMLDCAWANGLRPAGFEQTTATVAAMNGHLQDMRAITFAKLNVEMP